MDKALIESLHDAWLAAECEGRLDDLLDLCTEDIVVQPPIGRACSGRQRFRAMLAESAGTISQIDISDLSIEVFDGIAVKRARFSTRLVGAGSPVEGTHLWLLRPRWKVSYITWSLDSLPA